jgi:A/G-specific adenine glycosylase
MTPQQDVTSAEPKPSPVRVAIAAVIRPGTDGSPEVLAAWRSRASIRGGVWEFPGGKIEPDESAADAARRETREELGIDIEVIGSIATAEDFDPSQPREHHVAVELMLARSHGGDPTVTDRIWRWMPMAELDDHPWPRANAALIAALQRGLAEASTGM